MGLTRRVASLYSFGKSCQMSKLSHTGSGLCQMVCLLLVFILLPCLIVCRCIQQRLCCNAIIGKDWIIIDYRLESFHSFKVVQYVIGKYKSCTGGPGDLWASTSSWRPFGPLDVVFCALQALKPWNHTDDQYLARVWHTDRHRGAHTESAFLGGWWVFWTQWTWRLFHMQCKYNGRN